MRDILENIKSPADIRGFSNEQLEELADAIRKKIISALSNRGGHLASGLGVVELTIALHYIFNTPDDILIWDVGHQCYPHKILTGRAKEFETIRQPGGLSGFCKRSESEYDMFGAGHASTSISAALGFAAARDLAGKSNKVIAVIGDGSMTGGMAFEGLNNLGALHKDMIVILNDNEMSISENVGAIPRYLNKIITNRFYNVAKHDVRDTLLNVPKLGKPLARLAWRIQTGMKRFIFPNIFFEDIGIRYFGPISGHDIKSLVQIFEKVKHLKEPIIIHTITRKGRGMKTAEKDPIIYHGPPAYDPDTGELLPQKKAGAPSYSSIFGTALTELAERNDKVVAITAAMREGTGLVGFANRFPERFFDVGIAEEHAVTFAAGLALNEYRPVAAIYSTFLQRAFDQIIHDVALQNIPVIFCMDRAGLVGADGPTHHGAFDLSYLRLIPNMTIMVPRNGDDLRSMMAAAVDYTDGPTAIRYPRGSSEIKAPGEFRKIEIGKGEVLRQGTDLTLIALGPMVDTALKTADLLAAKDIKAGVIDARFVKPMDEDLIIESAKSTGRIVTLEENSLNGGFGSAVMELLEDNNLGDVPVKRLGLPDKFITHGNQADLLDSLGLSPEKISHSLEQFFHAPIHK